MKFSKSLATVLVISAWFYLLLWLLGIWGYVVAIPSTAAYFAWFETW